MGSNKWQLAGLLAAFLGMMGWMLLGLPGRVVQASGAAAVGEAAPPAALPNSACAGCHREIFESYRTTPMARASGAAGDGFLPGDFRHAASGVRYRMVRDAADKGGRVYLDFARERRVGQLDAADQPDTAMTGRRELKYFLGSGTRGRTYLFEQEGYWFEIPINWYGKKRIWDMAPGYLEAREMPLTLPVDPGCLRCHASGAQSSMKEAREKYAGVPFTEGGITCTACHAAGEARAHIASGGRLAMARIGAMEPVKRDSVCLNCHLEGEAAVVRLGKRLEEFRPGESVFAYASYFVRSKQATGGERATSQWEALLESGCRRGAGERLTCTSCHDPHASTVGMTVRERVEFYRGKCLACQGGGGGGDTAGSLPSHPGRDEAATRMGHPADATEEAGPRPLAKDDNQKTTATATATAVATATAAAGATAGATRQAQEGVRMVVSFSATHHPEERDCAACHMPRANSNDIAHEQVTDHRIPRIARVSERAASGRDGKASGELLRIGTGAVGAGGDGVGAGTNPESSRDLGGDLGLDLSRDLGLAYAMAAAKGDRAAGERAMVLLKEAEGLAGAASDHELHAQLGFLEQISGDGAGAAAEYERALAADPEDAFAAGNLALLKAGEREYGAAVGLWSRAFEEDPVQLKAGMNLALVECGLGKKEAALGTLDRMLAFSPDDGQARELSRGIRSGAHGCGKR